jgi:hypothetical protein
LALNHWIIHQTGNTPINNPGPGIAKGTGTIPLSLFLCEKIFYLRKRNFDTGWINDKSGK